MTVEIPLTQGMVAVVDDEDAERLLVHRWFVKIEKGAKPYAARSIVLPDGRPGFRRMHHEVLGVEATQLVDHIDGDGLNNRRHNLRPADHFGNARNARPNRSGTSPFKGVSRTKDGRWQARICAGYQDRHLGRFSNPIDAAVAYDAAAIELHGEFAWLNADHFEEVACGQR